MRHEVLGAGAGLMEGAGFRVVVLFEKGSSIVERNSEIVLTWRSEYTANHPVF